MKKYLLSLLLLAPGIVAAQKPEKPVSFVLKGQLGSRLNAPDKIYLRYGRKTDSTEIRNGHFLLKGSVDEPKRAWLYLSRDGEKPTDYKGDFYLEKGTLTFTSPDSLKNATVTGGKLTAEYQSLFAAKQQPVYEVLKTLEKTFWAGTPEQRQSLEFKQGLRARRAVALKEDARLDSVFITTHPNSLVSLDQLDVVSDDKARHPFVEAMLPTLSPALRDSPQAVDIRNRMRKAALGLDAAPTLKVGMQAPDLMLPTPDGKQVSLNDYRGKYVLVDFWASWCGPCRAENPNVIQAYNAYKNKNFDILGVSLDEARDRAKWLKAIQDDQLAWTQISDLKGWQSAAATAYLVRAIPQNFLVDPTGKIIAMNLRGESLQQTLAQLVK
ncbi:TlpA disulfide reductase family protein [Hymenobacter defluvii]|uniref:AhpC/TSA family protein n=1 Tax=Hymenobacter defluvii TaxID=2054411 RepID=A0ABS3T5W7_9BACT|nr:TlpA disulfide reductase family protein [Hymenobacter defluvii]MBO3269049.1 AhpC/TSA family protein [Hymenobacter defluvii]